MIGEGGGSNAKKLFGLRAALLNAWNGTSETFAGRE